MKPISLDLRKRIVAAYGADGGTYEEIATRFAVGEASVSRLLRRHREKASLEPDPHGGGQPPRIQPEQYDDLRALVAEQPDRTVQQLAHLWAERFGVNLSRSAMQRALLKAGFSWKKNAFVLRNSSARGSKSNAPSL